MPSTTTQSEIGAEQLGFYKTTLSWESSLFVKLSLEAKQKNPHAQEPYSELMSKIHTEYYRCDETFIDSFREKYSNALPPSWMLLEITSFGTLSMIFKCLRPGRSKREIANKFGLDDSTFESWMHSIVYVRNLCAHHSRVWNRVLNIRPSKLMNPQNQWLENADASNKRIFYFASIMVYFLNTINPNHQFRQRFISLINEQGHIDFNRMGFTDDWKDETLWKY